MTQHRIEFDRNGTGDIESTYMDVESYDFLARAIRFFAGPNTRTVIVYTDNEEYHLRQHWDRESGNYGDYVYSLVSITYKAEQDMDGRWTTSHQSRAYETPCPLRMLSEFLSTFM